MAARADSSESWYEGGRFGPVDHLVVLAPSPEGYAQLSRLISQAQLRGEKIGRCYRWEDLAEAATKGNWWR